MNEFDWDVSLSAPLTSCSMRVERSAHLPHLYSLKTLSQHLPCPSHPFSLHTAQHAPFSDLCPDLPYHHNASSPPHSHNTSCQAVGLRPEQICYCLQPCLTSLPAVSCRPSLQNVLRHLLLLHGAPILYSPAYCLLANLSQPPSSNRLEA